MSKPDSTAVTRLIELAHARPATGRFDWFASPPPPAPSRPEVTLVVRRPRGGVVLAPRHVLGAFVAGALAFGLGVLAMHQRTAGTAPAPAAVPVATAPAAPVVLPVVEPPPPPAAAPIVIALDDEPAPPAPVPAPSKPAPAPPPRAPRPAPAAPPEAATAQLLVSSKPPCELFVDGQSVGWTPQRGLRLREGKHLLLFRNPEQGVEHRVAVIARPGETIRVVRDFTDSGL